MEYPIYRIEAFTSRDGSEVFGVQRKVALWGAWVKCHFPAGACGQYWFDSEEGAVELVRIDKQNFLREREIERQEAKTRKTRWIYL